MRRVLIVGLGGSGGKTVSFLMDELLVRLRNAGWDKDKLPSGWQFVHVDVPGAADGLGSNLAAPVADQGGTYIGLASGAAGYSTFASAIESNLENQMPSDLSYLARWRPGKDADVIAISGGAGAYRAVGRIVTVAAANKIHSSLARVIETLSSVEAIQENAAAGQLLKFKNAQAISKEPPLIMIVSSLSGGSGASMAFDVSDILRSFHAEANFDGQHTGAFLYTADVFKSLGIFGAAPGSIATISELINSLHRTESPWTEKEWNRLGVKAAVPNASGRGPAMIFPVGASVNGVRFGREPEDVYRGFSRMIAPIFADPNMQENYFSYVMVNGRSEALANPDNTGLLNDPVTGKTGFAHFVGWGSATLSMGRDRYIEYSAQRIARKAVETLVQGHIDEAVLAGQKTPLQAVSDYAEQLAPIFWQLFNPSDDATTATDAKSYVDAAFPKRIRSQLAQSAIQKEMASQFNGASASTIAMNLEAVFPRKVNGILSSADSSAQNSIEAWATRIQSSLEEAILRIASMRGLDVADRILSQAKSDLLRIQDELSKLAASAPSVPSFVTSIVTSIRNLGNSPLAMGGPADNLIADAANKLDVLFKYRVAEILSRVLEDFVKNSVTPLSDSLQKLHKDLDFELHRKVTGNAGAAYREAPLPLWPTSSGVPSHFTPAINEVLLDDIKSFPTTFEAHIAQALMPITSNQIGEAAMQVITQRQSVRDEKGDFLEIHNWPIALTRVGSHPHIDRQASWYPSALGALSGRAGGSARYEIKLDYRSLLSYARRWVSLPNTSFRLYSDQGIGAWLAGSKDLTQQEIQNNLNKIQGALAQTIQYASPLVEVEQGLVSVIHQPKAGGIKYNFSSLPFAADDPALSSVVSGLQGSIQAGASLGKLKEACDPNRDVKEIFISSTTGAPYVPLVFKSLTEPIRDSWAEVRNAGSTKAYWQWRRARPLREFIPTSAKWTEAFLQGWIMSRITGHIQLEARTDGASGFIAKVYDEGQQNWALFPSELLGVNGLGVRKDAGGEDESNWNVPPALLESLPLAMAHCQGMNLEPLRAYQLVTRIGATIKALGASIGERQMVDPTVVWASPTGASRDVNNVLDIWVTRGTGAHNLKTQIASLADADSNDQRIEKALAWVAAVESRMQTLLKNPISRSNFDDVNREYELAPELLRALDSVKRELGRGDIGEKATAPVAPVSPVDTGLIALEPLPDAEG
ncbi:MAG: tubulin-like doman-containing protein [Rhodoluna sp.]